jgi:hypothetical protein
MSLVLVRPRLGMYWASHLNYNKDEEYQDYFIVNSNYERKCIGPTKSMKKIVECQITILSSHMILVFEALR